jgi:hypothetical protein
VDDLVFLKLQPYVQSSLAHMSNQKSAFNFFDPYRVLQRIGEVAYGLQLPSDCNVHPVFHVSHLKKTVGAVTQDLAQPPLVMSLLFRFLIRFCSAA